MKKHLLILSFLMAFSGMAFAQSNSPMHGWHTYCASEFYDAISYGTRTTIATCYPPDMAIQYAGTQITKVGMFSDDLYNSVGGLYSCSIYLGGETPAEGSIAYTMTVDVPQGLGDWAEFDLSTPIWVTGDETIWIVWETEQPLTPFPIGVCSGSDPSGNGNWAWNGTEWEHMDYLSNGDWTVKTYFNWDGPQPQPQDIYFAGSGSGIGKVWKNNTLIHSISDTTLVNLTAMQVAPEGNIFTAGYSHDSTYDFVQGRVWLNDSLVFAADSNTAINALILNGDNWIAAGVGENEWENTMGLIWQNGEVLYAYSDSIHGNQINAMAIDTLTGDIYSGGISAELEAKATVWKNDTILWRENSVSAIYSIAFDGTNLYAAGYRIDNGLPLATLWQNDSIVFQIIDTSIESGFDALALYDSSIFLAGYADDSMYVWRDEEVLFAHPRTGFSEIRELVVNGTGIYYAGQTDNLGVWKDGEILYQPEDCESINALCVLPAAPLPTFNITVEADSTGWGTVSGGGTYSFGDTATIEAFPNVGCEFLFWNDSLTDNPLEVVVVSDSTFIAHFRQIDYLIETSSSPADGGTVTPGGIYHYGETITLEALPNPGYVFDGWNDGIPDNPREITVVSDSTFVANFSIGEYLIETAVTPVGLGYVTGAGMYHYGDTVQLEAFGNLGFEFVEWTDGNTDNPRTVIVTGNALYTAHIGVQQCTIKAEVTPEGAGTVDGQGTYGYGEIIQLMARNNPGYVFVQWGDGALQNPRSVFVEGNAIYLAEFNRLEYEITTQSNPEEGGTVSGGGTYHYGDTITLTATPNDNYMFLCWSDGIASNPRTVIVRRDAEFIALFYQNGTPEYTVTVLCNNPELGSVEGSGTYPEGATMQISATPNENAYFKQWDDGDMHNPRLITVTQDTTFTAFFAEMETYYTIEVKSDNPLMGSTYGSGNFSANTVIDIGASPHPGFRFVCWQDGNTDNPRSVTVTENATYTASFETKPVQTYTITVYYEETQGFVIGAGAYEEGSTATLAAIPSDDYRFIKWSDDNTDNPREIIVTQDLVLAAFFRTTDVDEFLNTATVLYPNPANDRIHIDGLEGETQTEVFNAQGILVKTLTLSSDAEIAIDDLASGLYLIRLGSRTFKFMKR